VLGLFGAGWVWGAIKYKNDWFDPGVYVATALVFNAVLKSWFASEASRELSEERRMGTLELLLSTPLRVRDILRGQWLALRRQFLGPFLAVLFVEVVMCIAGGEKMNWRSEDEPFWIWLWIAGMGMLVLDLAALYWVGLWEGLTAKSPSHALGNTLARVLILPWGAFAAFFTFASIIEARYSPMWTWRGYLAVWFALGLLTDLGFGLWARHNLLRRFREVSAQRYARRRSFWKRLTAGNFSL
jgi:hypothetical protein